MLYNTKTQCQSWSSTIQLWMIILIIFLPCHAERQKWMLQVYYDWKICPLNCSWKSFDIFPFMNCTSSSLSLNRRLNTILKSLRHLILITTSHCDPVLAFFDSFATVQIHFNSSNSSPLSQFNFSNFMNIQSFIICRSIYSDEYLEPIDQLEKFICPILCPHLRSLRIPILFTNTRLIGSLPVHFLTWKYAISTIRHTRRLYFHRRQWTHCHLFVNWQSKNVLEMKWRRFFYYVRI